MCYHIIAKIHGPVCTLVGDTASLVMEHLNDVCSPSEMPHSQFEDESDNFFSFDELDQKPFLLTAIQMQDWENVGYFLENDTWIPGSFDPPAESLDPETEVRRWIITKDASNNELWRKLPLHLAIARNAPKGILESLINTFPASLEQPDTAGNLPLHLIFAHDYSNDVVALFIQQYPEAVQRNNLRSLTPMECINHNIVSEESLYMNAKQGGRKGSINDSEARLVHFISREHDSKQVAADLADTRPHRSAFQPLVTRIVVPEEKSNQDRRAAMRKTRSEGTRTTLKKSRWKSMFGSFRTSKKELKRIDEEVNENDSSEYGEGNDTESKRKSSFFTRLRSKKNMSTATSGASSVSSSRGSSVDSTEVSISDTAEPTDDSTDQSSRNASLQVDSYDESEDRLILPSQTKSQSSENLSEYLNICSIQEDLVELKNSLGPKRESKSSKVALSVSNSKALYSGSAPEGDRINENSVDDSRQLSNTAEKRQEHEIRDDSTLSDIELLSLAMNKQNLQRAISDLMGGDPTPVPSRTKKVSFKDQTEASIQTLSTSTSDVSISEHNHHDNGRRRRRSTTSSCGDLVGDLSLLASSYIEDALGDDDTLDSLSYEDFRYETDLSSTDGSDDDDGTIESSVVSEPERGWRPLSRWDRAVSQRRKTRSTKEGGKSTAAKQSSFLTRRKQNQEPEEREELDEQRKATRREEYYEDPIIERDDQELDQDDWFCLSPEQTQFCGDGTIHEDDIYPYEELGDSAYESRQTGSQSNALEEETDNYQGEKRDSLNGEEEGEPKKNGRTFGVFRKPKFLKRRKKSESDSQSLKEKQTVEAHYNDEEESGHRIVWMRPSHPALVDKKDTQGRHGDTAVESRNSPLHGEGLWSTKSNDVPITSTDEAGEGWASPESWFALDELTSNEVKESLSYPTVLSEKKVDTLEEGKNVYLVQVTFSDQ